MLPSYFRSQSIKAFTLVEILISLTLLVFLVVTLLRIFEQSSRAWQISEKKADAFREARAAIYALSHDLKSLHVSEKVPMYRNNRKQIASNVDLVNQHHGDVFFFLSHQLAKAQEQTKNRGSLCAVGYYLAFDRFSKDSTACRLYRYFKNSDETWTAEEGYGLESYLNYGENLFAVARGLNGGDEVVASNVIDLFIRPYASDGTFLDNRQLNQKPSYFMLSLSALNRTSAEKLYAKKDWYEIDEKLPAEDKQVFHMRVAVE
ncbi:MAG: hypothetical protein AAF984_02165 [Verrucomicrobiota bacterium]